MGALTFKVQDASAVKESVLAAVDEKEVLALRAGMRAHPEPHLPVDEGTVEVTAVA